MDMDNQVRHDDPQFVKILRTCLEMEIAAANERLEADSTKVRKMKTIMRSELDRRKKLKEKITLMERIKIMLSEISTRLHASIRETSDTLEIVKANVDDKYRLIQLRSQEYQSIVAEFKETWHAYHTAYEEFPLAKARNAAKIKLGKLQIELMVMIYKRDEATTIIEQQRRVSWIRTRCKIIEFAGIMAERLKLEEKLTRLKANVNYYRRELRSIEMEVQVRRKKEEDQRRLRKQKMLEMGPPKINIPYRQIHVQRQTSARLQHQWRNVSEPNDDAISVNTVALEELCINENSTMSPEERTDIGSGHGTNLESITVQTETSILKNSAVIEETDTRVASVAPGIEASAEKKIFPDNDAETKETRQKETQKSQESAEERANFCRAKEKFFQHSAVQNEVKAKRMRLQTESDEESSDKIASPQPPAAVESADVKSPPSIPKIRKIETVHYDITSMATVPKPAHRPSSVVSSMFSPSYFEYCDSNMSASNQDFASKGAPSLRDMSLCNYQSLRLSPNSNMSLMFVEENAQMAPPAKYTSERNNEATSPFLPNNFMRKAKENFTLF